MRDDLPDFSRLPEDSAKNLYRFGIGLFVILVTLLLLAVIISLGKALQGFQWGYLRNGLLAFAAVLLGICLLIVVTSFAAKAVTLLWIKLFQERSESRKLKKASAAACEAISEKQRLNEDRARVTAQLQAAFLFEKESTPATNAKAERAFRDALQGGVMRSCEIAFEHIGKVIDQYEKVVSEIESSSLSDGEKATLLNSLTKQLDVAATEQRNIHAEKMMEAEIWKVRFRKARLIGAENPKAAVKYLNSIQGEARTSLTRTKVRELISSFSAQP